MITPAAVIHAFASEQVVRYPHGAELCDAHGCTGLDVAGGGIVAYLAPKTHPDFELIVFRTPAQAKQLLTVLTTARRRGNVLLYARTHRARVFRIFSTL